MVAIAKILILLLVCTTLAGAQTVTEKKPLEADEKLRKEAVAFLRETLGDVNGMRSLENRISFTAELASLMWFHDEREARAIYVGVIADFKDLLAKYDSQINALGTAALGEDPRMGGFLSFGVEPTDRSRLLRRFSIAMAVRQQIAMSIAEHDPDLAFGFYYDSLSVVSNAEFLQQHESRDKYFEHQLLSELANKNAASAAKYGARSLEGGVDMQHVELLKKIYAKDADKGVDFASAMLSRLKDAKGNELPFYTISGLVAFGEETIEQSKKPGGKRPVYTTSQLRELAEVLAQLILNGSETAAENGLNYLDIVEKYQPGRAAQIRAKFKSAASSDSGSNRAAANAMQAAAEAMIGLSTSNSTVSNSGSNSNSDTNDREAQMRADAEKKLLEDVESIGSKQLPKEERDRIVTQARKIIMQTSGRDKKIVSLSMLASQVAKAGDKELATEIMRDAEKLVNPSPKNYQDFMHSWLLASGYAQADPEKAFPLLEETIGRANETLAAFVKVGEFIDVAEEMIVDGEAQVGAFGGQMVRGLTKDLGIADMTIEILAKADFAKTKNLTNRFDRPEVRVLAKMMVLRAVLSPKEIAKPVDVIEGVK